MKKITFTLLCLLTLIPAIAQNSNDTASKQSPVIPFEKVYLQLDRYNYTSGEDIWFKAYLTDAFSGKLSDNSNCLYVEIISPLKGIIQRRTIFLQKGVGWGDFKLNDSIPTGKYLIRAYTSWMRNFGETFFYKKEIEIANYLGLAYTPVSIKENKPDIQFFPESGSLLEDVYSVVAFKAVDSKGKPINVSGKVVTSTGDTLSSFRSSHLGMGSFSLLTKNGESLYGVGKFETGENFRVSLSPPIPSGYILRAIDKNASQFVISIKTNQATLDKDQGKEVILVGTAKDRICISVRMKMRSMVQSFSLPKDAFPEGIARLTLYDSTFVPQCERLIYVSRNNPVYLKVEPEKKNYNLRQKVTLNISVSDSAGNPVAANLSLSAVDSKMISDTNSYHSNISSYLLLESEIKGTIYRPDYFFEKDRKNALDLLMLTQGWRDFIWKHLQDSLSQKKFLIEKGMVVSGKLRRLFADKPIANANVSMGVFDGKNNVLNFTITDSLGRYSFDVNPFFGTKTLIVSATNKNHKNAGMITLDSIFTEPSPIYYNPVVLQKKITDIQSEEAGRRYRILKQYRLSDTIELNEVVVKGRKSEKLNDDGNFRIYGNPDYVLKVTDEFAGYTDVFQLLQGRVAGLMIYGAYPNMSFTLRGTQGTPLFLLDGTPTELDVIASVPVAMVDKVEVLKDIANTAIFGMRGGNGVISVFTKKGANWTDKPVFHSINTRVNGFYQARVFYAPDYAISIPEHQKPDLRSTIFWAPSVQVDSTGKAKVTFFNADTPTTIKITAEGISEQGNPVHAGSEYKVGR